jgi:hypothetical protein
VRGEASQREISGRKEEMIHMLTGSAGHEFTTKCGLTVDRRKSFERFTGWWRRVTCPLCQRGLKDPAAP